MQSTVDETRRDRQRNNAARAGQVAIDFLADVLQSQVLGKVYGDWDGRGLGLLTDCYQSRRRHSALHGQSGNGKGREGTVVVAAYAHRERSTGAQSCQCQ